MKVQCFIIYHFIISLQFTFRSLLFVHVVALVDFGLQPRGLCMSRSCDLCAFR